MPTAAVVAAVLASLAPWASGRQVARHAAVIADTALDSCDDAAGLAVTDTRESLLSLAVERCDRVGPGGWGAFQLGDQYPAWVACGALWMQARAALEHLHRHPWRSTWQGYLGASSPRHPEIRRRRMMWFWAREACGCSCNPGWAP